MVNLPSTLPSLWPAWHRGPQARRLGHSVPLNEPDHVIDVRKLLAKSGSPSRRHPMASHRHQLRSSNVRANAFDGGDRPPSPQQRTDALGSPPSDLTQKDRHSSATGLNSCEAILGARKAPTGCPQASAPVGPRSRYTIQTRPQGASSGRGFFACTFACNGTRQRRLSRGEPNHRGH